MAVSAPKDSSPDAGLSRRGLLKAATAGLGGGLLLRGSRADAAPEGKNRVLRLAHLTDVHLQPELDAADWFARCLRHAQGQDDPPELILFGGDNIMDAFAQTRRRTDEQWRLWNRVLDQECMLPWETCIGNHDIWGWKGGGFEPKPDGSDEGKRRAVDELGLPGRYRSFLKAGWKFIVLDSTHPGAEPGSYTARLDEEQFDWLAAELAETPDSTPVLILSHIPILAVCTFFDGENEKSGDWRVPGAWMHVDARRITALFHERGNVRLCLSGHEHMVDRVDYLGTTYRCNGAVSGAWWKGAYHQFSPSYALVDLYEDGSSACRIVPYGWEPREGSR